MTREVYSFPLLKPREIFTCVKEMHVRASEEDIRACDPSAIRTVLEAFIEDAMNVTHEDMTQIAFPGLSTLSFPEIHAESIPELMFYRKAQMLLAASGVNDFGLRDIIHPTPKRVRRQLSALINFAKFREERLLFYSDITEQTKELLDQARSMRDENALLQRELDQIIEEQKTEEPTRVRLQMEVTELQKEINVLNKQQAVMHHEKDEKRDKRKEMEDIVASARFNKIEAEAEIERLEAQIVTSPDRVKEGLTAIAETVEKAKDDVHVLEEKRSAVLGFIDVYERAERELARAFALLEEIEQEMKACKEARNQVRNARTRSQELKILTVETNTRRQRLEKIVELKRRDLWKFIEEARTSEEVASKAYQTVRDKLKKLELVHLEVCQRIVRNTDASRKVEIKVKESEAQYEKELKNLEQMYSRFQQTATYYNEQVLKAIQSSS